MTTETSETADVTPDEYDSSDLEFSEIHDPDGFDLKVESPDGHTWYFTESNGPCRPGFGEGHTSLFVTGPERVTVSIEVWNGDEYDEHDVQYRLMDYEPAEDADGELEVTRDDEITLSEAVDWCTDIPTAECTSKSDVWAVIHADTDKVQGVIAAALKPRGVVIHKVERADGFVSIALEKFADDLGGEDE